MLISIDQVLPHIEDRRQLLMFLRHPYSDESCAHMAALLPKAATAYQAMSDAWRKLHTHRYSTQRERSAQVFQALGAHYGRPIDTQIENLLETQVVLLEEKTANHAEKIIRLKGGVASEAAMSNDDAASALQAVSLHEAIFMVFTGLFQLRRRGKRGLDFVLTAAGEEAVHNRTLTTYIHQQTQIAIRAELMATIESARERLGGRCESVTDGLHPALLDDMEARFLDSYFALSSRVQKNARIAPLIVDARMLCRWFVVLEMVRLAGEFTFAPHPERLARRLGWTRP